MAAQQTTENDDSDFKLSPPPDSTPINPLLCANDDCDLAGSPSTNNLCQKCFHRSHDRLNTSPRSTQPRSPPPRRKPIPIQTPPLFRSRREVNRCSGCSRKVGLTGFRCRCGELFCAEHRYSDRHDCSFDYKAAGREAISRENPVIKAAKIVRV